MTVKRKVITGIVKRHPDGFGFCIPEEPDFPDVFIPRRDMEGIMTNDRVAAEVTSERGRDRYSGVIIRVLERAFQTVVGRFSDLGEHGRLLDTSNAWGSDLVIHIDNRKGAENGQLVVAKVLKYPSETQDFEGEVIQIIGDAGDPQHDTIRIVHEHKIPNVWGPSVESEVDDIPSEVRAEDKAGRTDLTGKKLITIDGQTAKDFDDAICVETAESGFHLWVAIADVSHYVIPGSHIDDEAFKRGTSTYFPNYVVPMLPEKLSNGICSLKPNVERLALVAELHIDFSGEIQSTNIFEGVIKSHARVTYGQAQEIIEGNSYEEFDHVKDMILTANDLAKILMTKRFKEGALDLEIPETEVIIDESGAPIDIQKSERLFSHRLIEEMMLIANVAVARFLRNKKLTSIHRIHEAPDSISIGILNKFISNFGGIKPIKGGSLQKRISKALEQFRGKPEQQILNILTLRSMKQAKYSEDPIGHFGLGFADYTHFTSPIRRYPDLIVHRLIKSIILKSDKYKALREDQLAAAGVHLSACEQRSVKAERQLKSIKKARLMENAIGQEFHGLVSSVTRFGIFVLLREFDVDGLVKLEELGSEKFIFDEENLRLYGKKSGTEFKIGDPVTVQVASVDIDLGKIDFILTGESQLGDTHNRTTARKNSQKRGKTPRHRRGVRKARVPKRSRKS